MKKYFLFGLISGAIISLLYPHYAVVAGFSPWDWKVCACIAMAGYIIVAFVIWFKFLGPKLVSKNLAALIGGSLIGIFVIIGIYGFVYPLIAIPFLHGAGVVLAVGTLGDAFHFADIHILIRYIGQIGMQIIAYILACIAYKRKEL